MKGEWMYAAYKPTTTKEGEWMYAAYKPTTTKEWMV
jgi:hypothetical protein